jgi:hypothetical protein
MPRRVEDEKSRNHPNKVAFRSRERTFSGRPFAGAKGDYQEVKTYQRTAARLGRVAGPNLLSWDGKSSDAAMPTLAILVLDRADQIPGPLPEDGASPVRVAPLWQWDIRELERDLGRSADDAVEQKLYHLRRLTKLRRLNLRRAAAIYLIAPSRASRSL